MEEVHSPARILIVDDETAHLNALCDTLGDRGFITTGFVSSKEALAAAHEHEFDLLLTDLMMPEMNGIDLLRAAQQVQPQLVGVLMTGHGTIDTAVEAMKVGALDYILKPFNLSTVSLVLSRALAIRQLRMKNAVLEERVKERTRELETKNADLDAFSLAVSHDLGAPLRSIRGFAEIIERDHGAKIPAEARPHLARIIEAGRRMQDLIQALLRFSRLGNQGLAKRPVEVGPLVQEIVAELRAHEPDRQLDIRVGDLPDVVADQALLRQVFTNLLSNAFKFTRQTDQGRVVIEGERGSDTHTYWVRDNGAGFDMTYAKKLFGIFQRLHSDREFEGTGVGLSTVQRIVARHGGTVWAEGAVGKGATFRFTLPAGPKQAI